MTGGAAKTHLSWIARYSIGIRKRPSLNSGYQAGAIFSAPKDISVP